MKTSPSSSIALIQSTLAERDALVAAGMTELTPAQLHSRLDELGYTIDPTTSFSYTNKASPPNARHYLARAIGIKHKASGLSFANTKAPRDTLPQLQELRYTSFCFWRGRIWEI